MTNETFNELFSKLLPIFNEYFQESANSITKQIELKEEVKNEISPLCFEWSDVKPKIQTKCLLITATWIKYYWDYSTFIVKESDESEGLEVFTGDGEEWRDLVDLKADKYLVLPLLKNKNKL